LKDPSDKKMQDAFRELCSQAPGAQLGEDNDLINCSASIGGQFERELSYPKLLTTESARPPLFDFQLEVKSKIVELFMSQDTYCSALVSMPTGSGKTRTAVHAILELLISRRIKKVLWIAPSRELLSQAADTCRSQWRGFRRCPDLQLDSLSNINDIVDGVQQAILFSTPQLITSRFQEGPLGIKIDLIVFDEAHQSSAPEYRKSIDLIKVHQNMTALLGLSATPGRHKTNEIYDLVDQYGGKLITSDILSDEPVDFLVKRGVLSKIDYLRLCPSSLTGSKKSSNYKWDEGDILKIIKNIIVKTEKKRQKVIVFAKSISQAFIIAEYLKCNGFSAEFVSGATRSEKRKMILSSFHSGKLLCLINVDLLVAGYDCPDVQHVVIVRNISSSILYEQMIGRAIRGHAVGGTRKSYIWDFFDNYKVHGNPMSYMRYKRLDW